MTVLDSVRAAAESYGGNCSGGVLEITGIWRQEYVLRLTESSTVLALQFVLVQTTGQGCCYFDGVLGSGIGAGLLGASALDVRSCRATEIACLDAVLSCAPSEPRERIVLKGLPSEKALGRATVVVREVARLLQDRERPKHGDRYRIVNVGVVGEFVAGLVELPDVVVRATDFSPIIVNSAVHGVPVEIGTRTLEEVAVADVAVVTGMTLSNGTLDEIVAVTRRENTAVLVFAETGASFAPIYCDAGIDVVVSEPYPFYLTGSGESRLNVFGTPLR